MEFLWNFLEFSMDAYRKTKDFSGIFYGNSMEFLWKKKHGKIIEILCFHLETQ